MEENWKQFEKIWCHSGFMKMKKERNEENGLHREFMKTKKKEERGKW